MLQKSFEAALNRSGKDCFFSFRYDGNGFAPAENGNPMEYEIIPGGLKLRFEVTKYKDVPAIEYTPYFENPGKEPSGVISDFLPLDWTSRLPHPETFGEMSNKGIPVVYNNSRIGVRYTLGSCCSGTDFLPQYRELFSRPGANAISLESHQGRSSSEFLPFFGVDEDEFHGVNIAIGWSGEWKFSVEFPLGWPRSALQDGTPCRISAGMKETNFRVFPGESLRQPGILLFFRSGKSVRDAQNEFRRFMVAHHSPRDAEGKLQIPPISFLTWGGLESAAMKRRIDIIRNHKLPYETFWIDAGWMGKDAPCPYYLEDSPIKSDWPERVGNWTLNRYVHPAGLREISEAAHAAKMRLLVWFEAERIHENSGSSLLSEHSDWLLTAPESTSRLLNLGNPEAREWLTETIAELIEREGVDDYRQDFNIDPIPYWRSNDAPDRVGVSEMKYITGLYRFWEDLRKRFPSLFIDNCASGGRRLDYVLSGMSFALCQSDFTTIGKYNCDCVQLENLYLDEWLPLHGSLSWGESDAYHAFSAAGCGYASQIWLCNGWEPKSDHDYTSHRRILTVFQKMRDLSIRADAYSLVPRPEDLKNWCARQLHVPETNEGFVQYFRRPDSPENRQMLNLHGIDMQARYELEFRDGKTQEVSGAALIHFEAVLSNPRSVNVVFYRKL